MTNRERVIEALEHRPPDRVPVDLASTVVTGITIIAYQNLKKHLGIQAPTVIVDRYQQLASVDEEVLQRFDVDFRPVYLGPPDSPRTHDLDGNAYVDEWGVKRHKPKGSFYYDIVDPPLAGDITVSDVESYPWPDPHDPGYTRGLREKAEEIRQRGYAVMCNFPSGFMHKLTYLRGFEDSYIDMAANHDIFEAMMDRILEFSLIIGERMLDEVGDLADIVYTADDLATQTGPMMAMETYRKLVKPPHRKTIELIKSKTSAKVFYHCCGAARALIPEFIDIGVDILNPVQVSASGMDPVELKREFGKDLTLWGGIDAHRVMPYGTPDEVRAEVRRRIEEMGEGGGYVLGTVHNIQPDVPPENICAMYNAALERSYS